MQLPADPILADRWRLLTPIGEGAMGEVWHGRHEQLGHDVAIKVMKPDAAQDENLVARFRREARIAAKIRSKHIVRVEDFGVTPDGRPFLVMEYLRGQTLASLLERQRRPDRLFVLKAVQHIAAACDVAHPAGIVHRDLKPENCFIVADDDGEPLVKVLDFGVAKVTDNVFITMNGVVTGSHALLGTPVYMSPEQARGEAELDGRSDLWSLGIMTYEMLSGGLPFDVGSLAQVLFAVLTGPIPPLTSRDPTFAPAIDAWVSRALCRDRAQRFATGKEFSAALAAALGFARTTPSDGGWASVVPPAVEPLKAALAASRGIAQGQPEGYISGHDATIATVHPVQGHPQGAHNSNYPVQSAYPSISEVRTAELPAHTALPSAAHGIDPSALTWSGNGGGGVMYPPMSHPPQSYAAPVPQQPQQQQPLQPHQMHVQQPMMAGYQTQVPYGVNNVHTMGYGGVTPSKQRRVHPMGVAFLIVGIGASIALAAVVAKHRRDSERAANPELIVQPPIPFAPQQLNQLINPNSHTNSNLAMPVTNTPPVQGVLDAGVTGAAAQYVQRVARPFGTLAPRTHDAGARTGASSQISAPRPPNTDPLRTTGPTNHERTFENP